MPHTAAVVTASDRSARGERDDLSGPAVATALLEAGFEVIEEQIVPDERALIAELLEKLVLQDVALVVVTGGTGFSPRDVTPEATRDVLDREAPGLGEAMRAAGRAVTPMADLSRGIAGTRDRTLILNVPGSPKGAVESVEAVLPLLGHALGLLRDDVRSH